MRGPSGTQAVRAVPLTLAVALLVVGCAAPDATGGGSSTTTAAPTVRLTTASPPSVPPRRDPSPAVPTGAPTTDGSPAAADLDAAGAMRAFARDPRQDGLFAPGTTWIGLGDGRTWVPLRPDARRRPDRWRIGSAYAEREGPFSALDVLRSGPGTTRPGAPQDCAAGPVGPPPALRAVPGLHTVSIVSATAPDAGCIDWWAVTLFVDGAGRVHAVLLRLGSS